jgi:hypothetical protein
MPKKVTFEDFIKTKMKNKLIDDTQEEMRKKIKIADPNEKAGFDFIMNSAKTARELHTLDYWHKYTTGKGFLSDDEDEEDNW